MRLFNFCTFHSTDHSFFFQKSIHIIYVATVHTAASSNREATFVIKRQQLLKATFIICWKVTLVIKLEKRHLLPNLKRRHLLS